jgi:hypothetical protein
MNACEAFPERRDARVSIPAAFPAAARVSKNMNALIPVYHADGSLFAWASEQRFARLQSAGLVARIVRHRKGHINRAILFLRPGEPKPMSANSVTGTRYSFREHLTDRPVWELKHLGRTHDAKTYAPSETRAFFLQVIADCLVP